jgi:hypothetical protein
MLATAPPATWSPEAVQRLADATGGTLVQDAYGPAVRFQPGSADRSVRSWIAPLPDFGMLSASGDDAARFLHAQLTNDVEHLGAGEARWTGYCSPKGRLLSTFRSWRDPEAIHLLLARPLADALRRRLSMFVLRLKARVVDASDGVACFGLTGPSAASAAAAALGLPDPAEGGADHAASVAGHHLVGLPPLPAVAPVDPAAGASRGSSGPNPRWLLVVPADRAQAAWQAVTAVAEPMGTADWRRTEVLAGVPRIVPGTYEQFVPQMLNFESVDGVSFRKGCYPGQEIVARSQYLGKLKRRMFVGHGDGPEPPPGSDVTSADSGEPCGQVVIAAPDPDGGFDLLFECPVASVESGRLRAGESALHVGTLPYPLKSIE